MENSRTTQQHYKLHRGETGGKGEKGTNSSVEKGQPDSGRSLPIKISGIINLFP